MASRQNSSQMLSSSQSSSSNSTNSTSASAKDKTTSHKSSDGKNKQDKSSSSSTTSGHVPMSSNTIINSMNNMSKQRKGTSFQITSVSVNSGQQQQQMQHQRAENNDYETPSFSEDTFSREEVFFGQPSAFDTYQVPVIPTSSQYGLAIVGPDLGGNGTNLSDVHATLTDAGINIIGQIPNKQDVDHKNERFKVVKIESTEPFKRGRWMCMDYLDHTTLQAQDDGIDGSPKDEDENAVKTKDSGLESCLDNGDMEHMSDNDGYDQEVLRAEMQNHHNQLNDHHATSHHHTMTSIPIEHPVLPPHAQSMPQGHIEQLISQDMDTSETLPASQINNTDTVTQQQQHQQHAQSMTPEMIQRSIEQNPQFHQGVTLPTNILMQNIGLDQHHQQQQQQQSQTASIASPIPEGGESSEKQVSAGDSVTSQFQQVGTGDNKQSNESESGATAAASAATNDNIISNSSVSENNFDGASPSSSAGLGTATEGGASEVNSATTTTTAATGGDDGQSLNEDSESRLKMTIPPIAAAKSRAEPLVPAGLSVAAALSSLGPLYSSAAAAAGYIGTNHAKETSSSARVSRAASPALGNSGDNNSASGTSAVAIDNKIEQAMDLVKSHLMFAVREEVEVLKEKIAELMDRINQLEVENTILKANASQETLSQLSTAATISPQTQQTSPAQQQSQSSPALSKINIDVLQTPMNVAPNQPQQQPPSQPSAQNPPAQQNPQTTS